MIDFAKAFAWNIALRAMVFWKERIEIPYWRWVDRRRDRQIARLEKELHELAKDERP